ncbi:MAG: alpha/beta fold hydrolase BchO [Pseudomonadota bacterium]
MPRAPLDWRRDGRDWPNRAASRFVRAGGVAWHVQIAGTGPVVLLLHGAGGATHSWRRLLPLLSEHFTVVAPDLPGHGFSAPALGSGMSLAGVARRLGRLCTTLGLAPALGIGHSAGAAALVRMSLDGDIAPRALVAINGALLPFEGVARQSYPAMARALSFNPLVPWMVSTLATGPNVLPALTRSLGTRLAAEDIARYARLARSPGHVSGVLSMLADWDLEGLWADCAGLRVPLTLLTGKDDDMVTPSQANRIATRIPQAEVIAFDGLGHLAHEEAPEAVATAILGAVERAGL